MTLWKYCLFLYVHYLLTWWLLGIYLKVSNQIHTSLMQRHIYCRLVYCRLLYLYWGYWQGNNRLLRMTNFVLKYCRIVNSKCLSLCNDCRQEVCHAKLLIINLLVLLKYWYYLLLNRLLSFGFNFIKSLMKWFYFLFIFCSLLYWYLSKEILRAE